MTNNWTTSQNAYLDQLSVPKYRFDFVIIKITHLKTQWKKKKREMKVEVT